MTNTEAIKIIESECYIANLLNLDRTRMVNTALDMAVKSLSGLKTGKWIHWIDDYKDYCTCSCCAYGEEGEVLLSKVTPYCPYCGSRNEVTA